MPDILDDIPEQYRNFVKILVIDDILYVVESISRILRDAGYFVLTAKTGKEALQKYEKYRPDIITVDQKLPDMTGVQLIEKIRTIDERSDGTGIIFISSVYTREEIHDILQHRVDHYLIKPFRKEKLLETVKDVIDKLDSLAKNV